MQVMSRLRHAGYGEGARPCGCARRTLDGLRCIGVLALLAPSILLADDAVSCHWERRYKDGYVREVDVSIQLRQGRIAALRFQSSIASGAEGGAYQCRYDSTAPDTRSRLTNMADGVRFTSAADVPHPRFEVTKANRGYAVTSASANYFCGFGAEFPEVQLVPGDKKCRVTVP